MNLLTTPHFTLATYAQGTTDASKVALVLPGKLDTKDYTHMRSHVDFLASKGFFALSFDPPGTWESPGDISLYTMTNYLQAINEIIAYYGNKPTFLVGHSRGASMAMVAGLANPAVTSFFTVFTPFGKEGYKTSENVTEWEKNGYVISKRDLPPGGGEKVKEFHLPYAFHTDEEKYNIVEALATCLKPKMFMYGLHDPLAKPEKIKELYELAAPPKEIYELNSDHDYRLHTHLIHEVNTVMEKFLHTYQI